MDRNKNLSLKEYLNKLKPYLKDVVIDLYESDRWKIQLTIVINQGFGREKDGNRGKFIGSNLVIFCYKEFEKFILCKSISQLEVI